jgi:hypothetical protein
LSQFGKFELGRRIGCEDNKDAGATTAGGSIPWKVIFEATNSTISGIMSKSLEGGTACECIIHSFANQHAKTGGTAAMKHLTKKSSASKIKHEQSMLLTFFVASRERYWSGRPRS